VVTRHYNYVTLRLVESAPDRDDAQIVAACLHGDAAAQRHLFRTHFKHVHGTVYRILGTTPGAEDATQETFVEVFRSLRTFQGKSKLATWIDRIAIRVAFRQLRAGHRNGLMVEVSPDLPGDGPAADGCAHAREGLRRLYQAMDRLPPRTRVAFALHVIDGRSMLDTAQLTGCSLVATKVRVWRARRVLEAHAAADPVLADFVCTERGEEPT
jgi:RNA polymerase sigma-70 factor (ECF subfamily)